MFQWKKFFIHTDDCQHAHDGDNDFKFKREHVGHDVRFYKCPTCDGSFPKLSSLFMHVESPVGCQIDTRSWRNWETEGVVVQTTCYPHFNCDTFVDIRAVLSFT